MSNENDINIAGLDKAEILAALYNNSRQQGMGFMHSRGSSGMTVEQARDELKKFADRGDARPYFDYLHGRVMKVELYGDMLSPYLYDRDNGQGAVARVIEGLRKMQAA